MSCISGSDDVPDEVSLFVIGGYSVPRGSVHGSTQINVYKLRHGVVDWHHSREDAPYAWCCAGSTAIDHDIYIAGGMIYEKPYLWAFGPQFFGIKYTAIYKTKQAKWEMTKNITQPRTSGPAMFSIGSKLYLADGSSQVWNSMESLDLNNLNAAWEYEDTDMPFDIQYSKPVTINNVVYICGGWNSENNRSVISWRPGMTSWTSMSDMNHSRQWHCTLTDSTHFIWVVGGCDRDECDTSGFIEQYSISSNSWTQLNGAPDTAYNRVNFCAFWKGFIYVTFYTMTKNRELEWVTEIEPHFHIYNTNNAQWSKSDSKLRSLTFNSITAIIP